MHDTIFNEGLLFRVKQGGRIASPLTLTSDQNDRILLDKINKWTLRGSNLPIKTESVTKELYYAIVSHQKTAEGRRESTAAGYSVGDTMAIAPYTGAMRHMQAYI